MCDCNDEMNYVPESEHTELVFDGLIDTINGSEGLNLTNAQLYVQGVLYASGGVRTMSAVAGNESFLGAIGDGVKAVWEYIKNVFRAIFGVFFKTDLKEKEARVEKALDKMEKELHGMANPKITTANVDEIIKEMAKTLPMLPESPKKKELEKKVEEAKAEPTPATKVAEVKRVLIEVFELSLFERVGTEALNDKLVAAVNRLEKRKKQVEEDDTEGYMHMDMDIDTFLNGLIGLPKNTYGITNANQANEFIKKAKRCLIAMTHSLETFKVAERTFQEKIKSLEGAMNNYRKDDPRNKDTSKSLEQLKRTLGVVSDVIGVANNMFEYIEGMCGHLGKAIVSKEAIA